MHGGGVQLEALRHPKRLLVTLALVLGKLRPPFKQVLVGGVQIHTAPAGGCRCQALLQRLRVDLIGLVLQDQGDLTGARTYLERALAISEPTLGADHPQVAVYLFHLAQILRAALANLERAIHVDETTYGPDYLEVATDLVAPVGALQDLGDVAAARVALERAVHIRKQALGSDHDQPQAVRRLVQQLPAVPNLSP
jgi:tetratricopeptide (TPR) repeat protein